MYVICASNYVKQLKFYQTIIPTPQGCEIVVHINVTVSFVNSVSNVRWYMKINNFRGKKTPSKAQNLLSADTTITMTMVWNLQRMRYVHKRNVSHESLLLLKKHNSTSWRESCPKAELFILILVRPKRRRCARSFFISMAYTNITNLP